MIKELFDRKLKMKTNMNNQIQTKLEFLKTITTDYSDNTKENLDLDFLKRVLEVVPANSQNESDLNEFSMRIDKLLNFFSEKTDKKEFSYMVYSKELEDFKDYVNKKYNLIPKGYYKKRWLATGIAIGLGFGLSLNNIALGIPFGIGVGLLTGAFLDRKAEKENRVL